MLTELLDRLAGRQRERRDRHADALKQAIVDLAEGAPDLDLDATAALFEAEGLNESDIEANVELYLRRKQQAALAASQADLRAAARSAEIEFGKADQREAKRRKAAMQSLQPANCKRWVPRRDTAASWPRP